MDQFAFRVQVIGTLLIDKGDIDEWLQVEDTVADETTDLRILEFVFKYGSNKEKYEWGGESEVLLKFSATKIFSN